MNLLKRLKDRLFPPKTLLSKERSEALAAVALPLLHPSGHVIRTKRPEYQPRAHHNGGFVVKTMPRELRKIKEAQESIDNVAL